MDPSSATFSPPTEAVPPPDHTTLPEPMTWSDRVVASRLSVPLAATGWMLLQAKSWHQKPGGNACAVLALAAWGFALLATAAVDNRLHRLRAALAAVTLVTGLTLALWRLPSQLVLPTGAVIAVVASVQALWALGKSHRTVARGALLITGIAGIAIIGLAPLDAPDWARLALIVAYGFAIAQGLADPGRQAVPGLSAVRALVFCAAVLAPTTWYVEGGLPVELLRRENLCFLLLTALACAAASRPQRPTPRSLGIVLISLASLVVAGYAGAAVLFGQPGTAGPTLAAVTLAGGVLAIGTILHHSLLREAAMLSPWLWLPFVTRWVAE